MAAKYTTELPAEQNSPAEIFNCGGDTSSGTSTKIETAIFKGMRPYYISDRSQTMPNVHAYDEEDNAYQTKKLEHVNEQQSLESEDSSTTSTNSSIITVISRAGTVEKDPLDLGNLPQPRSIMVLPLSFPDNEYLKTKEISYRRKSFSFDKLKLACEANYPHEQLSAFKLEEDELIKKDVEMDPNYLLEKNRKLLLANKRLTEKVTVLQSRIHQLVEARRNEKTSEVKNKNFWLNSSMQLYNRVQADNKKLTEQARKIEELETRFSAVKTTYNVRPFKVEEKIIKEGRKERSKSLGHPGEILGVFGNVPWYRQMTRRMSKLGKSVRHAESNMGDIEESDTKEAGPSSSHQTTNVKTASTP